MSDWPGWARRSAYVAVVVVLALVATLVAGVVVARRPLPQVDGTMKLDGLSGKVEVLRDQHGIPQVYADTAEDLFRAQGFVQAQDRFFEMDFRRHTTAGRLSELFGESTVEADLYIRTMGWRRVAAREYDLLEPVHPRLPERLQRRRERLPEGAVGNRAVGRSTRSWA